MDIKKEIMKEFKWYDSSYLLKLMSVWLEDASSNHLHNGNTVTHKRLARRLKVMQLLIDRLEKDEYFGDEIYLEGKAKMEMTFWVITAREIKSQGKNWEEWKDMEGHHSSTPVFHPDEKTYRKQAEFAKRHNHMQREQDKKLFAKYFVHYLDTLWD